MNMNMSMKKGKANFPIIKLQTISEKVEPKLIRDPYKLIQSKFSKKRSLSITVSTPNGGTTPKSFQ